MKLEREKDIPAFKGKTWRERMALRDLAKERDHSINWLQVLLTFFTFAPILALAHWLGERFFPQHPLIAFILIYFLLSLPIFRLLYALLITPRIRRALETDAKPST